ARILPGSPTTSLSDEIVPNSTLDVRGDGTVFLCPFISHYCVNFSALQIT
uniref:Uncharacterized protein n=1 Tax=Amphimedon queenslandica TaxID=400682 RepID=A0A1X7VCZ5_AMPQE